MFLSVLCGIHCLLTPFILVSAPWLSNIIGNESFHVVMLSFVIPVAVLSIVQNNGVKGKDTQSDALWNISSYFGRGCPLYSSYTW